MVVVMIYVLRELLYQNFGNWWWWWRRW